MPVVVEKPRWSYENTIWLWLESSVHSAAWAVVMLAAEVATTSAAASLAKRFIVLVPKHN
jgi:hypothetical protein